MTLTATLHHTEDLTEDTRMFWFAPSAPLPYVSGQFVSVRLKHDTMDDRGDHRWFSLSSSPTERLLAITTRFTPANGSTFKQSMRALEPGANLAMTGPMGMFTLPTDPSVPVVFVAGGIGITPLRSMVRWLRDSNQRRSVHLIYAAMTARQLIFMEEFTAYGATITPVVAQPEAGWTGETGQLDAERILALAGNQPGTIYYVSGPKPMVQALAGGLAATGLAPDRVRTDAFSGYQSI